MASATSAPFLWTTAILHRVAISVKSEWSLVIEWSLWISLWSLFDRKLKKKFKITRTYIFWRSPLTLAVVSLSLPVNLTWMPPIFVSTISPFLLDRQNYKIKDFKTKFSTPFLDNGSSQLIIVPLFLMRQQIAVRLFQVSFTWHMNAFICRYGWL